MTDSQPVDAVAFHSAIADRFSNRYAESRAFRDRLDVWSEAIQSIGRRRLAVDLGCGAGQITELLVRSSDRVIAIDASSEMVELCRLHTNDRAEYRCARLELLDLAEVDGADLVVASSVFEYLDDPISLLRGVGQAVDPGGVVLVSIHNRRSIYRFAERMGYRVLRRPSYLEHVVSRPKPADLAVHGFEIRSIRTLSPAPVVGAFARALGLRRWFDTLLLVELAHGAAPVPPATDG